MKYIIAGGDSFSAETRCWPHILARSNNLLCANNAIPSAGNDYICRSTIRSIQKHLEQGIDTSDMVVMPMWTFVDRKSFFVNRKESMMWNVLTDNQSQRHYSTNPASFVEHQTTEGWYGIAARPIDSGWVIGESYIISNTDVVGNFKKPYLLDYKTNEGSMIETLEWILFLQSFCTSHGIKLINLAHSYDSIFYYPDFNVRTNRNKNFHVKEQYKKNCEHLVDLIDDSLWIKQGLLEYTLDNGLPFESDNTHPAEEAHLQFTKKIIEPRLKEL